MFMETLLLKLGSSVAKSILSMWLQGDTILQNTSNATIDALVGEIPNLSVLERRRLARQFERTAESVAEKLSPFLEIEFGGLAENEREASILAVSDSFNYSAINTALLLSQDLDPLRLEEYLSTTGVRERALLNAAGNTLYEHLLRETCNYTVEIVLTLPKFASQAARESLRRESEIIDLINTVLKKLPDPAMALRDQDDKDLQFEVQYRRTVARKLDYLELFGLDVSPLSKRYALSVAYITLSVSESQGAVDDEEEEYVRVNEALAGHNRMLVRGDAGSGKTTLLQWLAVSSARKSFDETLEDLNDSVPFFIQLRRYANKELPRPEEFVAAVAPNEAGIMPEGWTHRQLESGRALVLVDGVDELSNDDRKRARDWLVDLTDTFSASLFVVTSRPTTPEEWLESANFSHCALQSMTLGDVDSFVSHWHKAIGAALPAESAQTEMDEMSGRLMATLRSRPSVRNLATSPLLCAMICALHRERSEQLPEDRMELYRVALELLLERRDLERRVVSDGARLTLKEKQIFLRDLAYWLELNNYSDAEEPAAVARIERKLPSMQRIRDESPGTIFRYLLERSGILRMPTLGRIDFVHRTFQEYLAAEEIVEQENIGMLIDNAEHDHWREVVILAAGHANLRQREELLNGLLKRGELEPRQRHRLHLLACSCLETSPEVDPELSEKLQTALSSLLPPKNMSEAQAVASAGSLAVPLLRGFQNERVRAAAASVRALALASGEEALSALEAYGNDRRVTIWNELIRTWSALHFDPNEFSNRVLAKQKTHRFLRIDNTFVIPSIRHLRNIRDIQVNTRPDQGDLAIFGEVQSLERLYIEAADKLVDLSPLSPLKHLKNLVLNFGVSIGDLSTLANFSELATLRLRGVGATDLSALRSLRKLKILDLSGTNVHNLSPISNCTEIVNLSLTGTKISDISALENLTKLRVCQLMDAQVVDLTPLSGAKQLERLDLDSNQVSDLVPLSNLTNLKWLDLTSCPIADLTPLNTLSNLSVLTMSYAPGIFDADLEPLFSSLQSLTIYILSGENPGLEVWQSISSHDISVRVFEFVQDESISARYGLASRIRVVQPIVMEELPFTET